MNVHYYKNRELIEDYLENSLSNEQSIQLETHLIDCSDCSRYMKELRNLLYLLKNLEPEELPSGFQQQLRSRLKQVAQETEELEGEQEVQDQQPIRKKMLVNRKTLIKWAAGIAAIFVLVISLQFIKPFGNTSPSRYDNNYILSGDSADERMKSTREGELSMPEENPDADEGEEQPWISYGEGFGEEALDTDISATIHLYVSNDWEVESRVEAIVAAAESAQLPVLEMQLNKIVLQIPKNSEDHITGLMAKLSDMGKLASENVTKDSETMTILIETAE